MPIAFYFARRVSLVCFLIASRGLYRGVLIFEKNQTEKLILVHVYRKTGRSSRPLDS